MRNLKLKIKPYSLWITYNMINKHPIEEMLPPGMELAKIKVLEDNETPEHKLMFNCYNIDSMWMKGSRLEIMTIAKSDTNFHFVVLDCFTNTLQWDPVNRIRGPNGKFKFNYAQDRLNYEIISKNKNVFSFTGDSRNLIRMTEDFAVKSNYDCFFRGSSVPISLTFNENEIMLPVRKLDTVYLTNKLWDEYREEIPDNVFMHEHAMEFKTEMPFF